MMRPGRFIKHFLPRGLFGRSLIIIVAPMVLLQGVVTYVFFERDLDTTTRRLARDVAADVALLVALEDSTPSAGARRACARWRRGSCAIASPFTDGDERRRRRSGRLPAPSTWRWTISSPAASGPSRHFEHQPRWATDFDIKVDVKDGVLEVLVPRDRVTVSEPDIFILWMVGSALILLGIAILFLRNQVRPIERLARAADSFGKGRAVPDFKPYGATEVRRAAQAFITMRERIERYVSQRTEMLAGVSHDLKTPLTRMKLALAMMHDDADTRRLAAPTSPRWSICWTIIWPSRAAKAARNPKITDLGELVRDTAAAAAKARAARRRSRRRRRARRRCSASSARRCAAADQSGGQCPEAWPQVAVTLDARRPPWPRSRSRMTARAFPKAAARKRSGPSTAWTKAAICRPAARAWAWPSPATSPARMAATSCWTKARWAD